jgi:rhodanese-related sulfurtransferase
MASVGIAGQTVWDPAANGKPGFRLAAADFRGYPVTNGGNVMQPDQWLLVVLVAVILALLLIKRLRQVSTGRARELAKTGALVLDVRGPEEFAARHLTSAVNLPLEQVRRRIEDLEPDRGRALLVHCQSGVRSAMACRILRGLGYTAVHDLGSFGRARRILGNSGAGRG